MNAIKPFEHIFQLIVEASPNALVLVNQKDTIVYLNKFAEDLFKYDKSELIDQKLSILIPKRFRKIGSDLLKYYFQKPTSRKVGVNADLYGLKKDNTEFAIEIVLNPIIAGDETLVLASVIDISDRKKAEKQFQLVVESAPNAIILVNEKGKIVLINKQTEILFGYESSELIGFKIEKLLPDRFKKGHPKLRNKFLENPQTRSIGAGRDLFAKRKDGSEVSVEIALNPIEGTLILVSIINITERKKRELELKHYRHKLEETNKNLNMFASITAHDLKSPLNSIIGIVQLIEMEMTENENENISQYIKMLKDTNSQSKDMIDGILEYSKDSLSIMELDKINLGLLINDIVNKYESNNKIAFDIGKSLPVVHHNNTALTQVVNNLLENSIKYNDKEICEITIDCIEKGNVYEFFIADNGPGIAKSNRKKIFHLFENLGNKSKNSTGIGLATAEKLITKANGQIWVESSEKGGAKFIFTIQK